MLNNILEIKDNAKRVFLEREYPDIAQIAYLQANGDGEEEDGP